MSTSSIEKNIAEATRRIAAYDARWSNERFNAQAVEWLAMCVESIEIEFTESDDVQSWAVRTREGGETLVSSGETLIEALASAVMCVNWTFDTPTARDTNGR